MSTSQLLGTALMLMCFSPLLSAQQSNSPEEAIGFKSAVIPGKKIILELTNLEKERTLVTLKNQKGARFLYEEVRKREGMRLQVELGRLSPGTYFLEVSHKQKGFRASQAVKVEEESVQLSEIAIRE